MLRLEIFIEPRTGAGQEAVDLIASLLDEGERVAAGIVLSGLLASDRTVALACGTAEKGGDGEGPVPPGETPG